MTAGNGRLPGEPGAVAVWPAGHRAALCFGIDVTGPPHGGSAAVPEPAYERTGAERLLRLLADTDVTATFTWSRPAIGADGGFIQRVVADGHEPAVLLRDDRLLAESWHRELNETRAALAEVAGAEIVGCKATGDAERPVLGRLAQELGFRWLMDQPTGDLPTLVQADTERAPIVHLPTSRWLDDRALCGEHGLVPRHLFEIWRDELDTIREEGGLLCLTLHPSIGGRPGLSRAVAQLLDYAIELGDLWLARADHLALWWLEQHRLP